MPASVVIKQWIVLKLSHGKLLESAKHSEQSEQSFRGPVVVMINALESHLLLSGDSAGVSAHQSHRDHWGYTAHYHHPSCRQLPTLLCLCLDWRVIEYRYSASLHAMPDLSFSWYLSFDLINMRVEECCRPHLCLSPCLIQFRSLWISLNFSFIQIVTRRHQRRRDNNFLPVFITPLFTATGSQELWRVDNIPLLSPFKTRTLIHIYCISYHHQCLASPCNV